MRHLRDGNFVHFDTLGWAPVSGFIRLAGEIACSGNIVIAVEKRLDVVASCTGDRDVMVETTRYAYNASVRGKGNVVRYDNVAHHVGIIPGHIDGHHVHHYDWRTNTEKPASPEWLGEDRWPTLGRFIQDVETWYLNNRETLPEPDGVVEKLATYIHDC